LLSTQNMVSLGDVQESVVTSVAVNNTQHNMVSMGDVQESVVTSVAVNKTQHNSWP